MLQIITKVPLFVFPLFPIFLHVGLRARRGSSFPIAVLVLIPSLFFGLSLFLFLGKYGTNPGAILSWFFSFAVGGSIGFFYTQKIKLQFDREKKRVEIPGSWIPLILLMSIFVSKFSLGMISSMMPHLKGSLLLMGLELFPTLILGIFAGRGINCLIRYRSSSI
jgi:hypothetical protein